MDAAEKAGKITAEDRDKIEKTAELPKNAAAFNRLPLQNMIEAYEIARPQEQKDLAPYLDKKKPDPTLPQAEQDKLLDRVDQLLGP